MQKPRVYKLFHTHDIEDHKIYFKTTMKDEVLIKLIKIWLLRLSNVVQEYDFGTSNMMKILETFNCKQISEDSGFRTYYEANLYEIWEYANTWYSDEEVNKPEYTNPEAEEIFKLVIKENELWHKELSNNRNK